MKGHLLLLTALCFSYAQAEELISKFAPTPPSSIVPSAQLSSKNIVLKGIYITSNLQRALIPHPKCHDLCLEEIEIPGGKDKFDTTVYKKFAGQTVSKELVVELKTAIIAYYRHHHRPVVTVDVPEQDITDGVVTFVVIEGHLNEVVVRGNDWFPTDSFTKWIRLKPGDVIDSRVLLQDVAWINRNPFHQADVVFSPGPAEGTTTIDLIVKDRLPIRFYGGADNTGNESTGQARYFVGFNWGNAFNADQTLSYQYTIGPSIRRFQSHTVDYLAPLPWRHVFELYGGYSQVHPHVSGFHSEGHSAQVSLRYHIPIGLLYTGHVHEIVAGADWKNTNNNLNFRDEAEAPVFNDLVNITQAVLGYDYGFTNRRHSFTLNPQFYCSPGQLFGHQSERDFNRMRPGAKNHYVYGTLALGDDISFCNGYVVSLLTRYQGSTHTLLPSEQFSLGGYDTVRGYEEREVNVDNGFCGNFEIRMKPLHFVPKKNDGLVFLAFTDYGIGSNIHPISGENKWHHLIGMGPGVRYHYDRYISVRVDVGYRLHKTQFGHKPGFRTHVGAILSY